MMVFMSVPVPEETKYTGPQESDQAEDLRAGPVMNHGAAPA